MTEHELILEIEKSFGFAPTGEQHSALETFARFMFHRSDSSAMVMRGCAGTGKTSLAAAMVNTMVSLGQRVVLLAPTGRAAKVFSITSGRKAHTIHRKIYRQRTFSGLDTMFNMGNNLHRDTLFVVDESSMIGTSSGETGLFGTGSLLSDLIQYVYSGSNCHLLFIGDTAQLPPVGQEESPALQTMVLQGYGLEVFEASLREVLRQSQQSGILYNATVIRQMITHTEMTQLPRIRIAGFPDIHIVTGEELIEQLASSYAEVGTDETMVITRSNKRCNIYNMGIRNRVLYYEEELSGGDRLMVVKNKYLNNNGKNGAVDFIANGDIVVVKKVRNVRSEHGFRFADVLLELPDYDNQELETTILLDTLQSEAAALSREQQENLYQNVLADYADIPLKADRMKAVRDDQYYNAMQVKYGYAVTCHKAQGGQWAHIYLDQGYMTDEMLTPDYIHWLYTAFTRATEHLYLVNWPATQIDNPTSDAARSATDKE